MCYVLVLLYHNVGQIANLSYTRTRPVSRSSISPPLLCRHYPLQLSRPITIQRFLPQQCLYLRPLPQGQGSLRPTFFLERMRCSR
jgi:hypothetical protein